MYSLMVLLGLIATTAFMHCFVYRRRRYCDPVRARPGGDALHARLGDLLRRRVRRRRSCSSAGGARTGRTCSRTALFAYARRGRPVPPVAADVPLSGGRTRPRRGTAAPRFGAPIQLSRNVLGGDRVTAALVLGAVIGLGPLTGAQRGGAAREARLMWVLIAIPAFDAAVRLDRLAGDAGLGAALLRAGRRLAPAADRDRDRARRTRRARSRSSCRSCSSLNQSSYSPTYKSDMRDIGGEMGPLLHRRRPRDRRPARADAARLLLPARRPATSPTRPGGTVLHDPSYMNWIGALGAAAGRRLAHDRDASCSTASHPGSRSCSSGP